MCNALDMVGKICYKIVGGIMENNNKDILQCFEDIQSFSNQLSIKSYVWGGYVQDIIEGKILREHGDIDVFIENMDMNIDELIEKFNNAKYKCSYLNDIQMLNLVKNEVKATINPIRFIDKTAIWKHIGEQGFISFPKDWLDKEYRNFYNLSILTAGIEFEYCIRKIIRYMNPNWTGNIRDKDIIANAYYEKKLLDKNISPKELLGKIWGYSPFWLKDGYNGYEPPVLVIGREYK